MNLGWIGAGIEFGSVVRKVERPALIIPSVNLAHTLSLRHLDARKETTNSFSSFAIGALGIVAFDLTAAIRPLRSGSSGRHSGFLRPALVQFLLEVLRTLVVPSSGSTSSNPSSASLFPKGSVSRLRR